MRMATDKHRVLVVEDETDIALLLQMHLQDAHCEVTLAGDGHQGMRLAFAKRWDLVILDIRLPGPDGLSICRALRREQAAFHWQALNAGQIELEGVEEREAVHTDQD